MLDPCFEVEDVALVTLSITSLVQPSGMQAQAQGDSPAWYLLLGDGIVSNTSHIRLLATSTARQFLVASILAQATAITRTHVAKIAALADLPRPTSRSSSPSPSPSYCCYRAIVLAHGRKIMLVGGGGRRAGIRGGDGARRGLIQAGRRGPEPLGRIHGRRGRRVGGHGVGGRCARAVVTQVVGGGAAGFWNGGRARVDPAGERQGCRSPGRAQG